MQLLQVQTARAQGHEPSRDGPTIAGSSITTAQTDDVHGRVSLGKENSFYWEIQQRGQQQRAIRCLGYPTSAVGVL